jgi:hypothetical protein
MSPTLMARIDGLPVQLLERQRVWPTADRTPRGRHELSAKERARIERQTAVVHECRLPRWARALMDETERDEIRSELTAAGLL